MEGGRGRGERWVEGGGGSREEVGGRREREEGEVGGRRERLQQCCSERTTSLSVTARPLFVPSCHSSLPPLPSPPLPFPHWYIDVGETGARSARATRWFL